MQSIRNKTRRDPFFEAAARITALSLPLLSVADGGSSVKPNIVFILADDLGYGDVGCYGQQKIKTPNIDRLAEQGLLFTDFYAGSPVCSPSRSVLMTGQHAGHTRVRGNFCIEGGLEGVRSGRTVRRIHLLEEDVTIGDVLKGAGYRTGIVGKWHIGGYDPNAGPMDRGFDEFSGWLLSIPKTISYYPEWRVINRELVEIPENTGGKQGLYETDWCTDQAVAFLTRNKERPFFLYLAYSDPHDPLIVPHVEPYQDKPWTESQKIYAAKVHWLDKSIGRFLQSLQELGLEKNTVVIFCSDNGPHENDTENDMKGVSDFFQSAGPLRGYKRDLYEGGIRVPMIVRWPGRVKPGTRSEFPWYFPDVMATLADIAGATAPPGTDGISVQPVLTGHKQHLGDRFLYWEFFERGFQQAVRWGRWKALNLKRGEPMELYDLGADAGEQKNVAALQPEIIERIKDYLKTARRESPNWPLPENGRDEASRQREPNVAFPAL